ncbi:MAG: DUF4279 domain-containing protein [Kiloniellales bacterium]|nr:DUF4279 domain-containing protein [Kiloniellales bacterium]
MQGDELYGIGIQLWIVGFDCDPDEISKHLDLQPTRIVRKGQSFPPPRDPRHRAKLNLWALTPEIALSDPLSHCIEVSRLLEPLRAALEPRLDRLATLPSCAANSPRISIYVSPWEITPSFEFTPDDFDFLKRLGLPFEIDIQNYGPEEDE